MKRLEITYSRENKDLLGKSRQEAREYYLNLYGNFQSLLEEPTFSIAPERDDVFILDFGRNACGLKSYGAEKYIAELGSNLVGYATPKAGHTAKAIAMLCEMYGKKAVFFAPASKRATRDQAVVMNYRNSSLRFVRVPAMKVLNKWINEWASYLGGVALPSGLADIPLVTAGIVKMCEQHTLKFGEPSEFYCPVSTGTAIRALQIGWSNAKAFGVAMDRNIHDGEKGDADVLSHHYFYYGNIDRLPKYHSTEYYDTRTYDRFLTEAKAGAVFINMGSINLTTEYLNETAFSDDFVSDVDWGDKKAFCYA